MTAAVVIPVRGGDDRIRDNLHQLAHAASRSGVQTYIVDNGIPSWLCRSLQQTRVHVVKCPPAGSYLARNAGVRNALADGHDLLIFTDGDCRPEPGWPTHLLWLAEQADIVVSSAPPRAEGSLARGAHDDYLSRLAEWAGADLICGSPIRTMDTRACVIRAEVFGMQKFDERLSFAADAVFGRAALERGHKVIGCHHRVLSHDPPVSWRGEYLKYMSIAGTLTEQLRSWPRRDVVRLLPEHAHLLLPPPDDQIGARRRAVGAALAAAVSHQSGWEVRLYRAVRELAWMHGWSRQHHRRALAGSGR